MSRLRVCILSEDTGTEPIRIGRRSRKTPRDDREEIFAALSRARHEPFFHVLDGTPETLLALAELNADLVFNLTEAYGGDDTREMNVAALLELLDLRFTGGRATRALSRPGQGACQEAARLSRDSYAVLRVGPSRACRVDRRSPVPPDCEAGARRRLDRHRIRRGGRLREAAHGANRHSTRRGSTPPCWSRSTSRGGRSTQR